MAPTNEVPASVFRRELGLRLKDLRKESGLTLAEVGKLVGVHHGHLSRIERGQRATTERLVQDLLDKAYTDLVTDVSRMQILDLVRADSVKEEPHPRHRALLASTQIGGYLRLERSARKLKAYELALVTGLLQTDEYAEAVIRPMRPDLTAGEVRALVKVRMKRQEWLLGADGATLEAVIDEAALRRPVGPPDLMKRQMEHLLSMAEHDRVSVRLLPLETGVHAGLYGSFMVMDFPAPNPSIVWVEGLAHSLYFEDRERVEPYDEAFNGLCKKALPPAEAVSRIEKVIKELHQ
ncbi:MULTISPECIES: helix-turn-helix domain-containing protein [Streptomyces]|uniref:Helix-turn-helix transcriptional regulator n=1 Tax=Streptomyces griseiscabiei TaxID=2993540 RepID=A0ABU4LES0_9ACTN|nr:MULTISPECIES: helix-turn-helix transcriptional regulator [Streptomyces]MBZ3908457.1 helix-turn-helix transcriptional regulator [Streptomyces griseiscabiei]MDX2913975.1 helix-turn-helix transcriptional regulator [Streptomyces griseiscabiei]